MFDDAQFSIIPHLRPGSGATRHADLLRAAMAHDRQRPFEKTPIAGLHRVAFRVPYDRRKLGPSIARKALEPQPPLDVAPSPQVHAGPVAGAAGAAVHRPLILRSGFSATIGRNARSTPANAAVKPADPVVGPGLYSPGVPMSRQRAFGDFDESIPGGFGLGARSGFASVHDEMDAAGSVAELERAGLVRAPSAQHLRGAKFGPPPADGKSRPNGPLDASTATPMDVAPGRYNSFEAFVATRPHLPRADLLGRPPARDERDNVGPSTYEPHAPIGYASGAPRQTTPAGSGGLRYSFSRARLVRSASGQSGADG